MNKFVMFTPTWEKTVGGTAKVARGLVYGIKTIIPSCKFFIISPDIDQEPNQDVQYIDGKICGSRLLFALLSLYRVRPSVIHCQGRKHQLLVGFLYKKLIDNNVNLLCSFYTQPTIRTFLHGDAEPFPHENILLKKIKKNISIFLLNRADWVVANSASLAENMSNMLASGLQRPIAVIPSGVEKPQTRIEDVEDFIKKNKLKDVYPIFLTVGVLFWDWKVAGILLLLNSFREVVCQFPSARLIIVGDGRYHALVKSTIEDLSLQAHVILTGNLQNTFIPIAASHIYCHLALNESCSVSIIEAMVSGKPIIVSQAGGNPELIKDEETGLIVDPTVQSVQTAMVRLAKDRDLSDKLGNAAKSVATARYVWPTIARKYSRLYLGASGGDVIQLFHPDGHLTQ